MFQLRWLLGFLATRGEVAAGLDAPIDTPPAYRDEQLPGTQPWETVQPCCGDRLHHCVRTARLCHALARGDPRLAATEVAVMRLDSILWRTHTIPPVAYNSERPGPGLRCPGMLM